MTIWEILGISATQDQRLIKRAYAKKLKTLDIEQEPEAFQLLKDAFDSASASCQKTQSIQQPKIPLQSDPNALQRLVPELETDHADRKLTPAPLTQSDKQTEKDTSFSSLLKTFSIFYEEVNYFILTPQWETLIQQIEGLDLEDFRLAQKWLLAFLQQHQQVLERQLGLRLLEVGQLEEADALLTQTLRQQPVFQFLLSEISADQRFGYFSEKKRLFNLLNGQGQITEWYKVLDLCQKICPIDGDVILLEICYLLKRDFRLKHSTIKKLNNYLAALEELNYHSPTLDFIKNYDALLTAPTKEFAGSRFYLKESLIPNGLYHLFVGYAAYHCGRYQLAQNHWQIFSKKQQTYLFTSKELKRVFGIRRKLHPVTLLNLILVAGMLFFIFKPNNTTKNANSKSTPLRSSSSSAALIDSEPQQEPFQRFKDSSDPINKLLYYFYLEPSDENFQTYLNEHFSPDLQHFISTLERQKFADYLPKDFYRFEYVDSETEETWLAGIPSDTTFPFCLLQLDPDQKIKHIYGPGWEKISDEDFRVLWSQLQENEKNNT